MSQQISDSTIPGSVLDCKKIGSLNGDARLQTLILLKHCNCIACLVILTICVVV